jgi:hypothetical protein
LRRLSIGIRLLGRFIIEIRPLNRLNIERGMLGKFNIGIRLNDRLNRLWLLRLLFVRLIGYMKYLFNFMHNNERRK